MVKETKRIFKVGTNVGSFLAKTATKNILGIPNNNIPSELTELLGNLKGPIMKVAQILATIPEALPKEYAEQLSKLQAEAPAMNWLFVKRRMSLWRCCFTVNTDPLLRPLCSSATVSYSTQIFHLFLRENSNHIIRPLGFLAMKIPQ